MATAHTQHNVQANFEVTDRASGPLASITKAAQRMSGAFTHATSLVGAFAGAGVTAFAGFKAVEAIKETSAFIKQIERMSSISKMPVKTTEALVDVFENAGVEVGAVEAILYKLNRQADKLEFRMESTGKVIRTGPLAMMEQMGISLKDGPDAMMVKLADKVKAGQVDVARLGQAFWLDRNKAYDLFKVLKEGGTEFKRRLEDAKKQAFITQNVLDANKKLVKAQRDMKEGWEKIQRAFGAALIPVIADLTQRIANNMDEWVAKAREFGETLGRFLQDHHKALLLIGKLLLANFALVKLTGKGIAETAVSFWGSSRRMAAAITGRALVKAAPAAATIATTAATAAATTEATKKAAAAIGEQMAFTFKKAAPRQIEFGFAKAAAATAPVAKAVPTAASGAAAAVGTVSTAATAGVALLVIAAIAAIVLTIYKTWEAISKNVRGVGDRIDKAMSRISVHLDAIWDNLVRALSPIVDLGGDIGPFERLAELVAWSIEGLANMLFGFRWTYTTMGRLLEQLRTMGRIMLYTFKLLGEQIGAQFDAMWKSIKAMVTAFGMLHEGLLHMIRGALDPVFGHKEVAAGKAQLSAAADLMRVAGEYTAGKLHLAGNQIADILAEQTKGLGEAFDPAHAIRLAYLETLRRTNIELRRREQQTEADKRRDQPPHFDFRGSKFDITQRFAEGFDPDRIAVAFANDLAMMGERKLQSGFSPIYAAA